MTNLGAPNVLGDDPRGSLEVPIKKLRKKNSPFQELHDNQRTSHIRIGLSELTFCLSLTLFHLYCVKFLFELSLTRYRTVRVARVQDNLMLVRQFVSELDRAAVGARRSRRPGLFVKEGVEEVRDGAIIDGFP